MYRQEIARFQVDRLAHLHADLFRCVAERRLHCGVEPLDFLFLLIVAAAMVAHTLRYHSRVITGLAFLLAFSTINISRAGPTSLIASAILAATFIYYQGGLRWMREVMRRVPAGKKAA